MSQFFKCEGRAFDFFQHAVAPVLSGHLDGSFWTQLIPQMVVQEPAVKNATLCISSLYEQFGRRLPAQSDEKHFAVQKYNEAIRELIASKNHTIVLLVCILFTCIEFLRGDTEAAINHCRHGIVIFNNNANELSWWATEHLRPIFCRLSLFPFFFGCTVSTFPALKGLDTLRLPADQPDVTLPHLRLCLDSIATRCVRFIRSSDHYRLGQVPSEVVPDAVLLERADCLALLGDWHLRMLTFRNKKRPVDSKEISCRIFEMRCLLMKIWVNAALERSDTVYDAYVEDFQSMVALAEQALEATSDGSPPRPMFTFEMGYSPLLYFAAIKCRRLQTRLAALRLMKSLAVVRENLWDLCILTAVARRVIELEHGVSAEEIDSQNSTRHGMDVLPKDRIRVADMVVGTGRDVDQKGTWGEAYRKPVSFILCDSDGNKSVVTETLWIVPDKTH